MKFATLLLALLLLMPQRMFAADDEKAFIEKVKNAVALLYSQNESGGMRMHCTVTAFEKSAKGYLFVTAAHCVGADDTQHEKVKVEQEPFFITFDEVGAAKTFYPAKVMMVGYQHRGDDFSILEVETKNNWPIIPLGNEKLEVTPAPYWNIASPLGLGKQTFEGNISSLDLDRPLIEGDINWQHALVLQQTGVNGGSSGSALIAKDQRAIVGFLVGTVGGSTITAIPVSRFKTVRNAMEHGKYRWYAPKEELEEIK